MSNPRTLTLELIQTPDGRWMTFIPIQYEVTYVGDVPVLIERKDIGVPAANPLNIQGDIVTREAA